MTNRLAAATSPYLLPHAGNPVDWYEWGSEALDRATDEDRPILLSVGYAACHWCHVMERESFEDEAVARLMNEGFVCIKVDREERPDVDAIYMDAVQAMTGHGGWPMTVFLTPDLQPFYAGTYFPPEDRHGMPGFPKVLEAVTNAWANERHKIHEQGRRVTETISRRLAPSPEPLSERLIEEALRGLLGAYDRAWGGFGGAPKFPQAMTLDFLLRAHLRGEDHALQMATTTLARMAGGGIFDQVGGGFHRYATDERWLVPHFEKMLNDNALLARTYLHAFQVTGRRELRTVCRATLDYLLRDLRHPDGAFFSAEDADSEGQEGRFYVWPWDDLVSVAGEEAARWFGASPEGNWEGANILWTDGELRAVPRDVEEARGTLLEARSGRVRPATDDKVLAAWNGLAIRALAEAGRVLGEARYVEAAERAASFVLAELRGPGGRLLRAWRDGRTSGPGYADDHACMAAACLTLYETTFDLRWFREARALADDLIRLFEDPEDGGFFQTGSDAEALLTRPKELFDNAVPSGNSVAAETLLRLALLTGDPTYERSAAGALRAVGGVLPRAPTMLGEALGALDLYVGPSREVAVIGDPKAAAPLVERVWEGFRPNLVLAAAAPDDRGAAETVALLAGRHEVDGKPAAYVCRRFACEAPVTDPDALSALLGRSAGSSDHKLDGR